MQNFRHLRLRCLLFTTTPVVLSVLLLIALSNLVTPIKSYLATFFLFLDLLVPAWTVVPRRESQELKCQIYRTNAIP